MKNLNLIRKIAWDFHHKTGIDWEELFSEASLAYVEALSSHNPTKSKVSTWAYRLMRNRLIDFCKKQANQPQSLPEDLPHPTFREAFSPEEMKEDIKIIYRLILDLPREIHNLNPRALRGKLWKLLKNMGWTQKRIWGGFKEIKNLLNPKKRRKTNDNHRS